MHLPHALPVHQRTLPALMSLVVRHKCAAITTALRKKTDVPNLLQSRHLSQRTTIAQLSKDHRHTGVKMHLPHALPVHQQTLTALMSLVVRHKCAASTTASRRKTDVPNLLQSRHLSQRMTIAQLPKVLTTIGVKMHLTHALPVLQRTKLVLMSLAVRHKCAASTTALKRMAATPNSFNEIIYQSDNLI